MAYIKKPKEWQNSSIPTAADFNRIEDNIAYLKENKEDNIGALSVSHGGTGATDPNAALHNLGIVYEKVTVSWTLSNDAGVEGQASSAKYSGTSRSTECHRIKIGDRYLYFGSVYITDKKDFPSDRWMKININRTILEAVASAKKNSVNDYVPGCIVHYSGTDLYLGNDQSPGNGFTFAVLT